MLRSLGVDGALIPRGDEHLGEYVPAAAERLAWLTGFTGSAGLAIVLADRAVLFTDGRYAAQAPREADPALYEHRHLIDQPPKGWLAEHAAGLRIGYDPWLHGEAGLRRLEAKGVTLVPLPTNPVDAIWPDRPAWPATPLVPHPIAFAGVEAREKRAAAAAALQEAGEAATVLADPHSIAWLLNLRAADLAYTPVALAFALLRSDGSVALFLDPARVDGTMQAALGNAVSIAPRDALAPALAALAGQLVRVDADSTPAWFAARLREAGAEVIDGEDPCRLPRACKNPVEQAGARAAHARDGVALIRFLAWFAQAAPAGGLTETTVADRLLAFRQDDPLCRGESFPAIVGAGPNGAIVHYRPMRGADRAITADQCVLIDSGAQYADGTTDVTRTLWTGPGPAPDALRARYTQVLRGHVALATLRFPAGLAGGFLDAVARRPLWDLGLDYDHGTGHGVGSFLSVHEGPAGISRTAKPVPLAPGMILSDEPGYYLPDAYGIRIENLLLVRAAAEQPDQSRPFLAFETLTLAPYARALIEPASLTTAERAWIDAYHARVLGELGPRCAAPEAAWLAEACAPL